LKVLGAIVAWIIHYWQVYNKAIADAFGAAGYPVPEEHLRMRSA